MVDLALSLLMCIVYSRWANVSGALNGVLYPQELGSWKPVPQRRTLLCNYPGWLFSLSPCILSPENTRRYFKPCWGCALYSTVVDAETREKMFLTWPWAKGLSFCLAFPAVGQVDLGDKWLPSPCSAAVPAGMMTYHRSACDDSWEPSSLHQRVQRLHLTAGLKG